MRRADRGRHVLVGVVVTGPAAGLEHGPVVQMFGNLAAVLAGFALACLVLYLNRQQASRIDSSRDQHQRKHESRRQLVIEPDSIATSLFYSMASLTVCAFLYSTLAGEPDDSARISMAMLAYGILLGSSVLSLFFAMTMLMLNHPVTKLAARRARWVVVVAGPALVLRFLAVSAGEVWRQTCTDGMGCGAGFLNPRVWGFCYIVPLVALSSFVTLSRPRRWRVVRWFLMHAWTAKLAAECRARPAFPSFLTITATAFVGVASLWEQSLPADGRFYVAAVDVGLGLAILLLLVFAFASGSVLDRPRPTNPAQPPDEPVLAPAQEGSSAMASSSRSTSDRSL